VLRGIFGKKRNEVVGGWRKLHNELHNLYGLPSIIRIIKSRMEKREMHIRFPEGKRPLGRPRRWWENII
jgi:hypothetical protein